MEKSTAIDQSANPAKKGKFSCPHCDKSFEHKKTLNRHIVSHDSSRFTCDVCSKDFTRKDRLTRHKKVHGKPLHICCGKSFWRADKYREHFKTHNKSQYGGALEIAEHQNKENAQPSKDQPVTLTTKVNTEMENNSANPNIQVNQPTEKDECSEKALGGTFKVVTLPVEGIGRLDPMVLLKHQHDVIKKKLERAIVHGGLKWYLSIQVQFSKPRGETMERVTPHFRGRCQITLKPTDIDEGLRESVKMYTSFIEYQRQGSNWTLDKVLQIQIHMSKYSPLKGSSYIPLPIKLRSKHAIINVQNKDKKCFMWSVLAALHPAKKDSQRVAKYTDYQGELDFTGISFPVKVADLSKFETGNKISINVLGYEKGSLFPIHATKQRFDLHVDLLLMSDGRKSHYCWIKDMGRLLNDRYSHGHRYYHCMYCMQGFTKERILNDHISYCREHGTQKVKLPSEEDKWLFYKDVRKQLKVPYIIYADFESFQVPIHGCEVDPQKSHTEKTTQHIPSSFAYKVVGLTKETSNNPVIYRGPDVAENFIECMLREQEEIEQRFKHVEPMIMTGCDWQSFKSATICHICGKGMGDDRVRDHCHVTGAFRGAAHNECNINYKYTGRIPVVFHNLRGYDSHLIMQAIGKVSDKEIKCIPNNMEKYISFSMGCMDFIDSFQFMGTSLEKLIGNLSAEGKDKFSHMTQHFGDEKIELLLQKQVYPYDYFDGPHRFRETSLPPKEAFRSRLTGEDVSEEKYHHAYKVWKELGIQNLGEYSDIYVLTDVLGLADVFENFRNLCLESYGLDAAHFYTAPGLAWQAALKMTNVRLELLTDIDQHLFIEDGLRGGISMISHRFAEANNPYVPGYNPMKPTEYITYLDANNLYGWAMSQYLPTHDFVWLTDSEKDMLDITIVTDDANRGYILEVDLEYPTELHDLHNEYPLAPERVTVEKDELSDYSKTLFRELAQCGNPHDCLDHYNSAQKLVPNLRNKVKYVVHYRNLKQYLSLGMKLTKVHRVLTFEQAPWLKTYIDYNTEKRKQSRNNFEKDFYKLMNNSVFGKTMENLRKRMDVKLVNSEKKAMKLTCKPTFHEFRIFSEDLVGVHMLKQKLYLNRPIYVGFSILDISKTLMYDFHYNYIKRKFGSNARLLFTDTDSLAYTIQTDDFYQHMLEDSDLFDTSEFMKLMAMRSMPLLGSNQRCTHIHTIV
ncbi:uncharacterized protein LOC117336607 [Pecten maximus]|uniref:uncharacterized protein LOC117336607 n=1 Tax=Pecten maximus TaxID=6579 RepID=UPI001458E74C|nr:uncharacterized protein LOC117336607 [Pecten maximus]